MRDRKGMTDGEGEETTKTKLKRETGAKKESLRYISISTVYERERDGGTEREVERWRKRLQWSEERESKSKTLRESPLIVVTAGWALLFG